MSRELKAAAMPTAGDRLKSTGAASIHLLPLG
jgi:hypothetical protein